jgi:DNA mismatch repair ATPase MutL
MINMSRTEHDSHPIGTTVKATHFLEHLPVRKQTAIKNSSKVLAKIRRLMQAYALARPSIRLQLHVLKANNNKVDFIYAPSANANVEHAVLKIIGKTCALQCEWTATEADGLEIYAFLPKSRADPLKISGPGSFVSVDSRPLASNRGTAKKIVTMFKESLCASCRSMSGAKEPFFCMNIICPPDSYDPNTEPTKNSVIFENEGAVLDAIRRLFDVFYPEVTEKTFEAELPTSAQRPREHTKEDDLDLPGSSLLTAFIRAIAQGSEIAASRISRSSSMTGG